MFCMFFPLKSFVFRSDAEPDALAKYVIALVKKPLAENVLEELCLEKLSVFLQSRKYF